jgi:hypothetical protein
MPKLVRQYTEAEVGKILKASENSGIGDGMGQGHSEGLHELVSVGRGRQSTSTDALGQRLLDERKAVTGAFDGCQVKAITFALNTRAGQNTLQYLNGEKVWYVFAFIDVANQNFKMVEATANAPKKKEQGPLSKPVTANRTTSCIAMKLMKDGDTLHIRTAYPMSGPPPGGQSKCQIYYAGGASLDQELPA